MTQGLGNYNCGVRVTLFDSADDTTLTEHRARVAAIAGAMQDVAAVQAVFTSQGDAHCYDVTPDERGRGRQRALGPPCSPMMCWSS